MRKPSFLLILSAIIISNSAQASPSLGLGLGAAYNGFGVNLSFPVSAQSLWYSSLGCIGFSSDGDDWQDNCGVGFGAVSTKWISPISGKHGLGIAVGITKNNLDYDHEPDNRTEYYIGASYTWYASGINHNGLNLGLSSLFADTVTGRESIILINIGYQF